MALSLGNSTQLQSLLDKASAGDPGSYDDLIALSSARLVKLTRQMLRGYPHLRRWEQTDDVFQGAAMRLHRSLSEVRPDSVRAFFGLATTQIRRTLIDLARHHFGPEGQGAKHETNAESENWVVKHHADQDDSPENRETWTSFHQAVERLPDDEREVFQLLWYGGMEQKQVAELLGISIPTVQRRWYRARHQINVALSGQQFPSGE
jgi:RNA polymerase sigma factor (sigma-70 family)